MFGCLVSAKYNMTATMLSQGVVSTDPGAGEFVTRQDPDTGEIIRVWQEVDADDVTSGMQAYTFNCTARGIITGGIRAVGTIEEFNNNGEYVKSDYIKMSFGIDVPLNDRSKVTNIAGPRGNIIWKEEESDGLPTIFNVLGVTPVIDPFGEHIENSALLQRAAVQ